MPIVTLTTDYGSRDPDVAALKGALLSQEPGLTIVDITHEVSPYNLAEAAHILRHAYRNFPSGTVHLLAVDDAVVPNRPFLGVYADGHYFLSQDHGGISMVCPDIQPDGLVHLDLREDPGPFPSRDLLCKVAAHLARGGRLELTGRTIAEMVQLKTKQATAARGGQRLTGNVVYIDNFGNLVTNISRKLILEHGKGRSFTVHLPRRYSIRKLSSSYAESNTPGMLVAIINHYGYLEIGLHRASAREGNGAAQLLGLNYMDEVNLEFDDHQDR